jgi:hypothetical protein
VRQEEPLTREELARLARRERQLTVVHAVALGTLLVAALAAFRYGETAWFQGLFLGIIGVLVAAAAVAQMMERCPRCGARLHRKLLVAPPEACAACGVLLRRPPPDG